MSLVAESTLGPYQLLGPLTAGMKLRTYMRCLAAALLTAAITTTKFQMITTGWPVMPVIQAQSGEGC
jgi:hypothetical protein